MYRFLSRTLNVLLFALWGRIRATIPRATTALGGSPGRPGPNPHPIGGQLLRIGAVTAEGGQTPTNSKVHRRIRTKAPTDTSTIKRDRSNMSAKLLYLLQDYRAAPSRAKVQR